MTGLVGHGAERGDGRVKVTGAARYAADTEITGVLHGALATSTVARGEITELDTSAALASPGVVAVYTHQNMLPLDGAAGLPLPQAVHPAAGHSGTPQRAAGRLCGGRVVAVNVAASFRCPAATRVCDAIADRGARTSAEEDVGAKVGRQGN